MITYQKLVVHPHAAKSIAGISLEDFDKSYQEIAEVHDQRMEQESHGRFVGYDCVVIQIGCDPGNQHAMEHTRCIGVAAEQL